jgi:hypothetical protein
MKKARISLPQLPRAYSRETVRSDGSVTRIFTDGVRSRIDGNDGDGKPKTITISRPDLGVAWSVDPKLNIYNESKVSAADYDQVANPEDGEEWEEEGTEVVGGVECKRYRGTRKGSDSSLAHTMIFVDPNTGIRHRTVTFDKTGKQRLVIETKAVKMGPPDASVFELPAGCKKV